MHHIKRCSRPERFSRDQGFFDDDEISSVASVPVRPRHSRQHRKVRAQATQLDSPFSNNYMQYMYLLHPQLSMRNDAAAGSTWKERRVSLPPSDSEETMTAVQAQGSYVDRRKSVPTSFFEREIANFTARKKGKKFIHC